MHGATRAWNKLCFLPFVRFLKDCETVASVVSAVERNCNLESFGKGLPAISKLGLAQKLHHLQVPLGSMKEDLQTFPKLVEVLEAAVALCGRVKELPSLWAQTLLREKGVDALANLEASTRASVPSSADIYVRGSEVLSKYNKQWTESESPVELVWSAAKNLTLGYTQVEGLCTFELSEFFPSAPTVMKVLSCKINSLCQELVKKMSETMGQMQEVPLSKWQPVVEVAKGADCNFEQVHADLWVDAETVQQSMEKLAAGQLRGLKPRLRFRFLMVLIFELYLILAIFISISNYLLLIISLDL